MTPEELSQIVEAGLRHMFDGNIDAEGCVVRSGNLHILVRLEEDGKVLQKFTVLVHEEEVVR